MVMLAEVAAEVEQDVIPHAQICDADLALQLPVSGGSAAKVRRGRSQDLPAPPAPQAREQAISGTRAHAQPRPANVVRRLGVIFHSAQQTRAESTVETEVATY